MTTIFNYTIDVNSVFIGVGLMIVFFIIIFIIKKLTGSKKPKHDLHNLKKIIEIAKRNLKVVEESIDTLDNFFKEIENQ